MENRPYQLNVCVTDEITVSKNGTDRKTELPAFGEIILTIAEGRVKFVEIRNKEKV